MRTVILAGMFLATRVLALDFSGAVTVGGQTRTYVAHVGTPAPVPTVTILVLHGHYGSGSQMRDYTKRHFDALADAEHFQVIYPDGLNGEWNADTPWSATATADDVAFLRAVATQLNADPARTYAAGVSNGGAMVGKTVCEAPGFLAAAVQVAGETSGVLRPDCGTVVPTVVMHGTADAFVPYNGITIGWSTYLAVEDFGTWLAQHRGCAPGVPTTTRLPDTANDGTTVDRLTYCPDVQVYRINGGGHTWPSGRYLLGLGPVSSDINAADIAWAWFKPRVRQ